MADRAVGGSARSRIKNVVAMVAVNGPLPSLGGAEAEAAVGQRGDGVGPRLAVLASLLPDGQRPEGHPDRDGGVMGTCAEEFATARSRRSPCRSHRNQDGDRPARTARLATSIWRSWTWRRDGRASGSGTFGERS